MGLHVVGRSREVMQDGQQHRSLYCPADTPSSLTMMQHPEVQQSFVCDVLTATAPLQESRESHGARDWCFLLLQTSSQALDTNPSALHLKV